MEKPKFDSSNYGYNIEQVDSFIEEINRELICANIRIDCLSKENKKLKGDLLSVISTLSKKLEDADKNDSDDCISTDETIKKDFENFGKELQTLKAFLD